MTEVEMNRALSLLDDNDKNEVAKVKCGLWAIVNEDGILGVYRTKAEGIDDALARHCQEKKHCKVKRLREGVYDIRILDVDEDPSEHYYHTYALERINADNILRYRELAVSARLPDWYFNPYSDEYRRFFNREDG